MDDVLLVVARPWNILLTRRERCAHRVQAGDHVFFALVDLGKDRSADAGHDAHVDHDVGRVGKLDADLRHGGSDGAHREGEHVHGAAAHGATKKLLELPAHDERIFPVVGRTSAFFGV